MAVKQKVVECVDPSTEARLQIILRALQDVTSRDGLQNNMCPKIVTGLGTVPIPSDTEGYKKFIADIQSVMMILAKECSNQDLIFITLKAMYDEISDPNKTPSPAMSIVLQLMDVEVIPCAVKYILNTGYPEQNLERALFTLCNWLSRWTWTPNLGPLVLAYMKGLETEHHYDILVEVTLATIVPLFKLLILSPTRDNVGPVVLYMLTRVQHSPEVFHKIIPHVPNVVSMVDKDQNNRSFSYVQEIVNLCIALMEHFPGYPSLYEPLKSVLQPYHPESNYKDSLNCPSWFDSSNCSLPSRCSIGKVGLNNLGNTCYMNSILQALFMTKTFRNEVLLHNKDMMPLLQKLQMLFALLQHSKKFSLSPSDILTLSRPPGFLPGHQHDSSEFLGYLLDTLHEQENTLNAGGEASAMIPTLVQQSFGGKTVTISKCGECSTRSERVDHFRELQLSFPTPPEGQSVQTLLNYYLQPEKLSGDNQYRCDVCARLTDGERVSQIIEAPPRLILTLKHFRYDPVSQQRTKILQRVTLDDHIRLEGACYELYAAVVHCGSSVDSGHYYTFAKDGSADWFKFNDCSVMKSSANDLCKLRPPETPYILFYCRKDLNEPDNLPSMVLSPRLQMALTKDHSEFETELKRPLTRTYNTRQQNRNDEPPPPGCGGGGFSSNNSNMFIC